MGAPDGRGKGDAEVGWVAGGESGDCRHGEERGGELRAEQRPCVVLEPQRGLHGSMAERPMVCCTGRSVRRLVCMSHAALLFRVVAHDVLVIMCIAPASLTTPVGVVLVCMLQCAEANYQEHLSFTYARSKCSPISSSSTPAKFSL